jgi:hypothetical protein
MRDQRIGTDITLAISGLTGNPQRSKAATISDCVP